MFFGCMKLFSITYDLKQPGRNYSELYDAIKNIGETQHPLESTWFVKVEDSITVDDVSQKLQAIFDNKDSLFVADITGSRYQGWLPKSFWEWLKVK